MKNNIFLIILLMVNVKRDSVCEKVEIWEGERDLRLQDTINLLSSLLSWQPELSFILLTYLFHILIFSSILFITIFFI